MVENGSNFSPKVANFKCCCGKIYKYDSGFYRHKKKCQITKSIDITDKDDLILHLCTFKTPNY
jgi:hypothetical protein